MRTLLPLVLGFVVLSGACDLPPRTISTMPDAEGPPLRLETPDAAFRISAADRAQLREGIDREALERFLGMVHPHYRNPILATFFARKPGEGVTLFNRVPDPVLQRALDEVWAPRRQVLTPEVQARAERNLALRAEPFDVLLVSGFRGAAALVVHAGPGSDRVILREEDATPSLLLAATERLMRSRIEHGLSPGTEQRFELTVEDDHNRELPVTYLPRQQALLERIRSVAPQLVPALGSVRRASFQALQPVADGTP